MENAVFDTLTIDINGVNQDQEFLFRTSGSAVKFPGFLVVYEETPDEDRVLPDEEAAIRIPAGIVEGQKQRLVKVNPEQHFTQPPSRYSEATLVRTLEENGIGRPSTYAPILSTLQERSYVVRENKRLLPTETGSLVNDLITEHFPNIVNTEFTAHMEDDLDKIASGEEKWVEIIRQFYGPFAQQVSHAEQLIPENKSGPEPIGRECPLCGKDLVIRWGRFGKFISCSGFPDCRHTEPWLEKTGVMCPKDGGEIVERKTRKNRIFYGCANYPTCDFTSWKQPLAAPCPDCGGLLVVANKSQAQCLGCETLFNLDDVLVETT